MALTTNFKNSIENLTQTLVLDKIGVAVSGGGDSCALLMMLHDWAVQQNIQLHAVTVDHGLRDGSAKEAKSVAGLCAGLGVFHDTLSWGGWDGHGNLQSSARNARYALIAEWAERLGIRNVALGHTLDDQAETVLMRLARGSGVDGLSAMSPVRNANGVRWLRPLLAESRQNLRDYLNAEGVDWIEDPSNTDEKFERVRVREALEVLEPLGITASKLAATANRLASARQVLAQTAHDAAARMAATKAGAVFFERSEFWSLATETRRRLISHALVWVSNQSYAPRAEALGEVLEKLQSKQSGTLHGCLIQSSDTIITISREPNAVANATCDIGDIWDGRWRIAGLNRPGLSVKATAENGLKLCANWRDTGLARNVLLSTPAVWEGDHLVAAPVAGFGNGWTAELLGGPNDFATTLLSH